MAKETPQVSHLLFFFFNIVVYNNVNVSDVSCVMLECRKTKPPCHLNSHLVYNMLFYIASVLHNIRTFF